MCVCVLCLLYLFYLLCDKGCVPRTGCFPLACAFDLPHDPLGFNTGDCITGDADCDGRQNAAGGALSNVAGVDAPQLAGTESAVVILNFASAFDAPFNASTRAAVGIPGTGAYSAANPIVARYNPLVSQQYPWAAFGTPIPASTVQVYNTPHGPDVQARHLQFVVSSFSAIPAALGLPWDASRGCIAFDAYLGSQDDAGIGFDFVGEKTTCPLPRPAPLPDYRVPRLYPNQHPGRAPVQEDPVYFHPLQCQFQFQQKLTVQSLRCDHAPAFFNCCCCLLFVFLLHSTR